MNECPATVHDVADVLARWSAQVPTAPVIVFGHSTGAQAALHAGRHYTPPRPVPPSLRWCSRVRRSRRNGAP